ncbi:MarR family winged helix-turn-helix transcriptional regulator [Neobacillus sp. LXY-4]|uniref:MarR family winged helix-turn-helix transcriptional regulator n=1 Tax=Neobacillus sp. LXY-4 TaxID=3379826 RepID=UPI003EE2C02E
MNNIGYLLMKVSKELKYVLTRELTHHDLTSSQWAVLNRLNMEEERDTSYNERTSVEIASKLDLDKPTISGIVNRLIEKGMIRKEQHPNDKRASVLFLTEKAKRLIPILERISNGVIEASLNRFDENEKEMFLLLLKKMDETLSREENE